MDKQHRALWASVLQRAIFDVQFCLKHNRPKPSTVVHAMTAWEWIFSNRHSRVNDFRSICDTINLDFRMVRALVAPHRDLLEYHNRRVGKIDFGRYPKVGL
jgi:hypothetical protein